MAPVQLFLLSHGASWVLPDGRVIKIPGFHDAWLASHPSIASGATNTVEFVKKSGWVSAVLHDQGYLEIIVRSKSEQRIRECLWNLLSTNATSLEKVVIMIPGLEGFITLGREDLGARPRFEESLDSTILAPE